MEVRKRAVPQSSDADDTNLDDLKEKMKKFDVFQKVQPEIEEKTMSGGLTSIIVFSLMAVLTLSEIYLYIWAPVKLIYSIDSDHESKVPINIDLSLAMPCSILNVDVQDQTGTSIKDVRNLKMTKIDFELSPSSAANYKKLMALNQYFRTQYYSLHQMAWDQHSAEARWQESLLKHSAERELDDEQMEQLDGASSRGGVARLGCRIRGTIGARKMPGMLLITAGRTLHIDSAFGHAHLQMMLNVREYNMSHRIRHLSFGGSVAGGRDSSSSSSTSSSSSASSSVSSGAARGSSSGINPLNANQIITQQNLNNFQYFIQAVATDVREFDSGGGGENASFPSSYQYSATMKNISLDHSAGRHGQPGVFFRFDFSPLRVRVRLNRPSLVRLLVQIAALTGGLFATTGLMHRLVQSALDLFSCRYRLGKYRHAPLDVPPTPTSPHTAISASTPPFRIDT